MNVRVCTYNEQREGNVAAFGEVHLVVIETACGTFRVKEVGGILHLSAENGQLVIHPRGSNLVKLMEEMP